MSLQDTQSAERIQIGFFGVRNAGKSSVVNAVTGQDLAVVSDVRGTTTDPVKKAMELLPLGPVVIIDTPGLDDSGALGEARVRKTREILRRVDIAVLVVDASAGMTDADRELAAMFRSRGVPTVVARNKCDLLPDVPEAGAGEVYVSAKTGYHIDALRQEIARLSPKEKKRRILDGLVGQGETAVLVVPIDESAPRGRLILPQQQVIRELLDRRARAVVTQPEELADTLRELARPPAIVITDSQAFPDVDRIVPQSVPLTSFSMLFARYRGEFGQLYEGASHLKDLTDSDTILIAEGCTHHRQCRDIGTYKLPRWIARYAGSHVSFETSSGNGFPDDLRRFALILHCGGCMLNDREMRYRLRAAAEAGVPITNYGMAIAKMNGILDRAAAPFFSAES